MKTPPTEAPFDYLFELVIRRTGHYYMSYQSLGEWEKEYPRMRGRLASRGIGIVGIDSATVKIVYHGSRYIHAN